MSPPALAAVVGATGTGKTALAVELAERFGGEIVSCDSAQIYIGLDVGTASPSPEERRRAPHHLIDVLEPVAQWSAADFAAAADRSIADIRSRGRVPILVGGNGLWFRALVRGLFEAPAIDPALRAEIRADLAGRGPEAVHAELALVDPVAAARIQPRDPQRIGRALEVFRQTGTPISELQARHGFKSERYRVAAVAIDWPRAALRDRLEVRVQQMYQGGLLEETERCLRSGAPVDCPGLSTIGYRDAVRVLRGELGRAEAERDTATATHRYAKRQRNWFAHEPSVRFLEPERVLSAAIDWLRPALDGV